MALKRMSPMASLLRTSRLFSLPPPLPKPASDFTATANFDSDTATSPYPTQIAIETTASSLGRGDWGLKRPLPRQSTYEKTTTPMLRIHNIDSIDHITDFDSAADHGLTLRKWQEMNVPISLEPSRKKVSATEPPVSAFESDVDNIQGGSQDSNTVRWKHKGPWLAGKSEGEFEEFVEKKVKRRKFEFRQFLREQLAMSATRKRREAAIESGEEIQAGLADVSDTDLEKHIKDLRRNEEKLNLLVERFLDLPSSTHTSGLNMVYRDRGPPTTHPSAGLSYLRTKSHIHNHPILGPMEVEPPVQGRVLRPQKKGGRGARNEALVGVAGIAADDNKIPLYQSGDLPGVASFDPDIPGGAKIWVHPDTSSIDSQGRVQLRWTDRASSDTKAIYLGERSVKTPPAAPLPTPRSSRRMPELSSSSSATTNRSIMYGLDDMVPPGGMKGNSGLLGPNSTTPAQGDVLSMLGKFNINK